MTGTEAKLVTSSLRVGGMSCVNCQSRIEKKLKSTAGVKEVSVSYAAGRALVTWDASVLSPDKIKAAIESLGYEVLEGAGKGPVLEIAGILAIILALYVLLRALGLDALASAFPLVEAGMGYGMVFVMGLLSSVHCVAMCGGLNLSQCLPAADAAAAMATPAEGPRRRLLSPAMRYNAGRVLSYTALGALVGALGSVIGASGRFRGAVQLVAGLFMVLMGLNMLGLFRRLRPRLPKIFAPRGAGPGTGRKKPLVVGLLNGLMPCGPLQAMQLYALSTGSPLAGGFSMFLFSMGTVPLMFGVGALSSLLSKKFTRKVMKAGAILVTVMGMTMFSYGWGLSGPKAGSGGGAGAAPNPPGLVSTPAGAPPPGEGEVQLVNSTLRPGSYPAITVRRGVPVKWIIDAPRGSITGCNNRMIIREYRIEHRFSPGENLIEFTPEKTGRFSYTCWMGMIRGSITVIEADQSAASPGPEGDPEGGPEERRLRGAAPKEAA